MSNIFLDALAVDVERAQRINHTLSLLSPEARGRTSLRPLDLLVIAPSQRLDDLAARHLGELPSTIRALLRALGVSGDLRAPGEGAALASYLLFEPGYVRSLMDLGRQDTLARRTEVERFLGLSDAQAAWPSTARPCRCASCCRPIHRGVWPPSTANSCRA